jgi:hypothetical protein
MGADRSATTPTQTLPQYTISTMVILPPCHHSGVVLWGLIIRQGIIFLAPSIFGFKHFMGACSSTQATSLIIILAQLHHIKLWGLDFFIYFTKKLLYKHSTIIIYQYCKTIFFLWGLYIVLLFFDSWYYFQRCSPSYGVLSMSKLGADDTDR